MSARPIGWYVHHHGDGHRQRALAIAPHLDGRCVLLGAGLEGRTDGHPLVPLDDDRLPGGGFDGRDGGGTPAALHYAPVDHDGVRRRVAGIAGWIAAARPALIVVDVSVEVAMLARIASVATVVVRLAGRRDDRPHLDAFRAASAVLAPFAAALDDPELPGWLRDRTIHAPGLAPRPPVASADPARVLGIVGRGGSVVTGADWAAAAAATPALRWRVIGPCPPPAAIPPNCVFAGWVDDPAAEIARAGMVVGGAGDGLTGGVIAARRPFVCLPEARPFDEQVAKAERLAALGAACVVSRWPSSDRWPALLDVARAIDPARQAALDDPDGPRRVAARLLALADAEPARAALTPA